jgi:hypothetical protein
MQVASAANAANAANVAYGANVANAVFRSVAVPPWREAAVVLWPALFATNSLALKASGEGGPDDHGKARKGFQDS